MAKKWRCGRHTLSLPRRPCEVSDHAEMRYCERFERIANAKAVIAHRFNQAKSISNHATRGTVSYWADIPNDIFIVAKLHRKNCFVILTCLRIGQLDERYPGMAKKIAKMKKKLIKLA